MISEKKWKSKQHIIHKDTICGKQWYEIWNSFTPLYSMISKTDVENCIHSHRQNHRRMNKIFWGKKSMKEESLGSKMNCGKWCGDKNQGNGSWVAVDWLLSYNWIKGSYWNRNLFASFS